MGWILIYIRQDATLHSLFYLETALHVSGGVTTHHQEPEAARLLRSWVRIPPGAWIFVCCESRVFSGRGLCDELITRPEESYRLCCVVVCDLETSRIGAPYVYDISSLRVKGRIHIHTHNVLYVFLFRENKGYSKETVSFQGLRSSYQNTETT